MAIQLLHLVNGWFPLKKLDRLEYVSATLLCQVVQLVTSLLQMIVRAMSLVAVRSGSMCKYATDSIDPGHGDRVHDLLTL